MAINPLKSPIGEIVAIECRFRMINLMQVGSTRLIMLDNSEALLYDHI
jgi:hypothetical protein